MRMVRSQGIRMVVIVSGHSQARMVSNTIREILSSAGLVVNPDKS